MRLVAAHSIRAGSEDIRAVVEDNNQADQVVDSIQAVVGSVAIVPGSDRTSAVVAAIALDLDRKSAAAAPAVAAIVVPG